MGSLDHVFLSLFLKTIFMLKKKKLIFKKLILENMTNGA